LYSFLNIDILDQPWALLLLGLLPIYLAWYIFYYEKRRLVLKMSYDPTKITKPKINLTRLRHIPMLLQLLGLFFLIFALARPQSTHNVVEKNTEGIDIMMVMDVSGSMETDDLQPDRLTVAKDNAMEFIKGRKGDRVGIVLFAEAAFSYAPLTLDYEWLTKLIKDINFSVLPKQGTAMGSAVSVGINRLRESKTSSKILIVFTDGANNRGEIDPLTAARLAQNYGIKIYTIGVGKNSYMRETAQGPQKVVSDLDEETLEQMASITNGKYFRADNEAKMTTIFQEISTLEKSKINEDLFRDAQDLYPAFVKMSILCFLLAFGLMLTFIYNPLEL
jgi:Ca-activated chloride channel homolog